MDLSKIKKGLSDPAALIREINKLYHTRGRQYSYNPDGTDIFAHEDWDNLIILDSCRYDIFKEQIDMSGNLEKRTSRGGMSPEFVRGNFSNKQLNDVVYVSANEWFAQLQDEINAEVHQFVNLQTNYLDLAGVSVRPETVTEQALRIAEKYPAKRLIIHYMQPHQPYIGPTGKENFKLSPGLIETLRRSNDITDELLWEAYQENLNIVLAHVKKLVSNLTGKTIITSDHGELLGERVFPIPLKTYGHFDGLYVDELVDVPWFICEYSERKMIRAEVPDENVQGKSKDPDAIEDRLRQLGYKT